ncbi:flavodoxin [Lawsonibacter faecis]|uniref:Flavodoxin n=1 Tax=Lawsonibacter faecis TaxID=2763052 RepID=A0A8J6JKY0_9FIRM|nr:flavodoxin [Lawsonibacter faecis]MBC5736694.1 flavodoxin [Lawsonibacter faecis]
MSKLAVIYWSGTGNTEAMAMAVGEGAKAAGAEVSVLTVSEISAAQAAQYDVLALGCPAMGAEVLEEGEFEPFFTELEGSLSGRKTALFGSYGWGDGQWMRDWCDRARAAGAVLCGADGLMLNEAPDDAGLDACRALGASLAAL